MPRSVLSQTSNPHHGPRREEGQRGRRSRDARARRRVLVLMAILTLVGGGFATLATAAPAASASTPASTGWQAATPTPPPEPDPGITRPTESDTSGTATSVTATPSPSGVGPATPSGPGAGATETATENQNCTLIVPPNPLTAAGLATPYRLIATDPGAGVCHETNANQSAFAEAAILNPAIGKVSIYHPLVIDDRTQPAVPPVGVRLPARAAVAVWFGFQANTLSLRRKGRNRRRLQLRFGSTDRCVNGTAGSPFGQFAYCGAPEFFAAANTAVRRGRLTVPALGTARDGKPCPTTRDFSVVDQDQSDNLPTKYLALADGRTAQFSPANQSRLAGSTVLTNASDNGLLDGRIDPALGCQPFTAPDLSAGGAPSAGLALNELQAAAHQPIPVALVPATDPMTQVNNESNLTKTNLYRAGVDQPRATAATGSGTTYCDNLGRIGASRLAADQQFTSAVTSPDPAAGATLFDFLVQRFNASWGDLTCQQLTGHGPPAITGAATTAAASASPPATPTDQTDQTDPGTLTSPGATTPDTTTDPGTTTPGTTTPDAGTPTDPGATTPDPTTDPGAASDPAVPTNPSPPDTTTTPEATVPAPLPTTAPTAPPTTTDDTALTPAPRASDTLVPPGVPAVSTPPAAASAPVPRRPRHHIRGHASTTR